MHGSNYTEDELIEARRENIARQSYLYMDKPTLIGLIKQFDFHTLNDRVYAVAQDIGKDDKRIVNIQVNTMLINILSGRTHYLPFTVDDVKVVKE